MSVLKKRLLDNPDHEILVQHEKVEKSDISLEFWEKIVRLKERRLFYVLMHREEHKLIFEELSSFQNACTSPDKLFTRTCKHCLERMLLLL